VAAAEILLAGIWIGSYLFTTFIVSPALNSLPISAAERITVRSAIGRRYGRLSVPLLLIWLVLLLWQGPAGWTLVRLLLLILLTAIIALHGYIFGSRMQLLAAREQAGEDSAVQERARLQKLSARITPLSLVLSVLLGVLTLL
jgi:uncharacterized membrane protein